MNDDSQYEEEKRARKKLRGDNARCGMSCRVHQQEQRRAVGLNPAAFLLRPASAKIRRHCSDADQDRPTQRDFTETIKILAGLSRFIIADITNPKSSPLELQATMPEYMIPFVPIIQESEEPFAMFRDLKQKYGDWVLDVLKYDTADNLVRVLEKAVVRPALEKGQELLSKKAEEIRFRHVKDFQ
jgi:hypothetical protein